LLAVAVGLLTLFSMVKIWTEVFWKPAPAPVADIIKKTPASPWMLAPVLVLAAAIILLGLGMEPVIRFAETAAGQLLDPGAYVAAVRQGARP